MDFPNRRVFPPAFIPDHLIAEILSFLSVKTILRLKCVSKSWYTLISHPTFVQNHLNKSSRNPNFTLTLDDGYTFIPFRHLLENPSIAVKSDAFLQNPSLAALNDTSLQNQFLDILPHFNDFKIVDSCNGLILLCSKSRSIRLGYEYRFYIWNPATRIIYDKLGSLYYCAPNFQDHHLGFKFAFGFDDTTERYKVVAYRVVEDDNEDTTLGKSEVKVFSLGDSCWRNILSFPVIPLNWINLRYAYHNDAVHLSGTINWLAVKSYFHTFYEYKYITHVEQFVIVSLDLSTETYKQLLLPPGFDKVPSVQPVIRVLMDCLCFSHDFKNSEFVLWQMKEYGVQESWTQLFKIDYQNLQLNRLFNFRLVCLYINGDEVIILNGFNNQAVVYNLKNEIVQRIKLKIYNLKNLVVTRFDNNNNRFTHAKYYVESLVSVS
ncbi:F-box/kelch-repeat protein At3g23880-like [Cicer arietinum]|uniref:F-box/kelch-repeat protein At3g23880-like n=1 Tax=Cicer arietinum TaxID=3827 RepID=A0A1S2XMW8_CICAR|nr:F-box/kelch-repeat protein At3g23880-like [Cicer arietinum]